VTMPSSRREAVADIVRAHDVLLFEDDAYGALEPSAVPLTSLIPERSYYAATLSKCIAPGLRTCFLVAPAREAADALTNALRAAVQMPVSLIVALVTRWLRDGSADAIIGAIKQEATARQKLARQVLAGHAYAAHPSGHHLWLPLPASWSRAEFAAYVQRQGLALVTSDHFSVGETSPHAIRVALGAAASRHELVRALEVLAAALRTSPLPTRVV
jgi:DNA-binding transcriptional MocR family regulator